MHIEIDGIPIEIIKKSIKNMNLRIYAPDGQVKMTVPLRCSQASINQCLQNKITWIRTQRDRMRSKTCNLDLSLQTGSTIEFLGKQYLLMIKEKEGSAFIQIQDQLIFCYIPAKASQSQLQSLIDKWYREEMLSILPKLISHWENIVQVKVRQWGIKKMKTRWGSCNTRAARIWLNMHLIKKPIECLEYVLLHELVHLLEPSHNKRFYSLMSQFMPNWREYELILKR